MAKALFPLILLIGTVIAPQLFAQDTALTDGEFNFRELVDLLPVFPQNTALTDGEFNFRELVGFVPPFLALILYFVPTIIAHIRDAEAYGKIFFFNVLLGWTGIGWLAALIWSLRAKPFFLRRPFPMVLIVSAIGLVVVLITVYLQVQPVRVLILQ